MWKYNNGSSKISVINVIKCLILPGGTIFECPVSVVAILLKFGISIRLKLTME